MSLYFISNKKIPTGLQQQPDTKKWQPRILSKHFSITRKLFAAYSITFLLVVGGMTAGFEQGRRIEHEAIAIHTEADEDIDTITALHDNLLNFFFLKQRFTNLSTPKQEDFVELQDAYESLRQQWRVFLASDELLGGDDDDDDDVTDTEAALGREFMEEHADDFERYLNLWHVSLIAAEKPASFTHLQRRLKEIGTDFSFFEVDGFLQQLHLLCKAAEEEQAEAAELVELAARRQFQITVSSIAISGVIGLGLIYYISNILMSPLKVMTRNTREAIENQDFDLKIDLESQDEIGVLAETFNTYSDFVKNLLVESDSSNKKLEKALVELKSAQSQIIQSEKMSSLGQLVAGVAHEINNPVSFVHGNMFHLETHTRDLLQIPAIYKEHYPETPPEIAEFLEEIDVDFVQEDLPKIIASMRLGTERITEIVLALRNFSRLDNASLQPTDIHSDLANTLMILHHRLVPRHERPEIIVTKDYGELPALSCYPGLLNQVFMNLLVNALDALDEKLAQQTKEDKIQDPPQITISTSLVQRGRWVRVAIADNGLGIPEKLRRKVFEPFFTTKPIGKGTGMGLSISYQLITEKHSGHLKSVSTRGKGTEMIVEIPLGLTESGCFQNSLGQSLA